MLFEVVSLKKQVIMFLFMHLDYYQPEVLKKLPTMLRKKLLLQLPIADVLLLESSTIVTEDINMNEVWRELVFSRLYSYIVRSIEWKRKVERHTGLWRAFYLEYMWSQVYCQAAFDDLPTCETDNHHQRGEGEMRYLQDSGHIVVKIECYKSMVADLLFGIELQVPVPNSPHSFKFYCIYCPFCNEVRRIIPRRYLMHYIPRRNKNFFTYFLSMFWIYAKYQPDYAKLYNCANADSYGLAEIISLRHPKVLATPLSKVKMMEFTPKYCNETELHSFLTILSGIHKTLEVMKLRMKQNNEYPWHFLPVDCLPSKITEMIIEGGCDCQDYAFLEHVVSERINKLTSLSLHCVPVSNSTNEEFVTAVCALFLGRKFKKLSLFDAELSLEVLHRLMERFLSHTSEQELELKLMRVLQFSDPTILSLDPHCAVDTRGKSLSLLNLFRLGFGSCCHYLLDALEAVQLRQLTITIDMVEMLYNRRSLPVQELEIDADLLKPADTQHLKNLMNKDGINNITVKLPLDEWVDSIHLENASGETLNNVIMAMEIGASCFKLKRLVFYSKHDSSRILGSTNPLSLPVGIFTAIFDKVFAFPNLHLLTLDFAQFKMTSTHLELVVKSWLKAAERRKIAQLVITVFKGMEMMSTLSELTESLKIKQD